MMTIHAAILAAYEKYLVSEERCRSTIEKYMRNVAGFAEWLGNAELTKEKTALWKAYLSSSGLTPETVNGRLAALISGTAGLPRPIPEGTEEDVSRPVKRTDAGGI